jgi:hypothetical protein
VTKAQAGRKGGCRRSPAKRKAGRERFRRIALASFIGWISDNPQALSHPDLQTALDSLTELLVMRKITQLGLADGIVA